MFFHLDPVGCTPLIVYYDAGILPEVTCMNMFHEIRLNPLMKVVIEKSGFRRKLIEIMRPFHLNSRDFKTIFPEDWDTL